MLNKLSSEANLHEIYSSIKGGILDEENSATTLLAGTVLGETIATIAEGVKANQTSSSQRTPKHKFLQPWHETHSAKRIAMAQVVIGESNMMSPVTAGPKTVGDKESSTCWMELVEERADPVTMEE